MIISIHHRSYHMRTQHCYLLMQEWTRLFHNMYCEDLYVNFTHYSSSLLFWVRLILIVTLESLSEQSTARNVLGQEASTMIWMTSARTTIITRSLRCWGAGHLAITSRHVGSGISYRPQGGCSYRMWVPALWAWNAMFDCDHDARWYPHVKDIHPMVWVHLIMGNSSWWSQI